jgi:hypothetical protein
VAFAIDQDQVKLVPARFTLESAYGSVDPPTRTADFEQISREAKEEHVEKTTAKLRRRR